MKEEREFLGLPLWQWVYGAMQESKIDQIVVAAFRPPLGMSEDDARWFKRKPVDAHQQTEEVIFEWLDSRGPGDHPFPDDKFLLLQCTSPYTTAVDINEMINKLDTFESAVSVAPFKRFLWGFDGKPKNYNPTDRPMRQDLVKWGGEAVENGAIYATHIKNLESSRCRVSGHIGLYTMKDAWELDTPEDWEAGKAIMSYKLREEAKLNG